FPLVPRNWVVDVGVERADDDDSHERNRRGGDARSDGDASLGPQAFERTAHLRGEKEGRADRPQGGLSSDQEEPHPKLAQVLEDVSLRMAKVKDPLPAFTGK